MFQDLDSIIEMLRGFYNELPPHVATPTDENHVRAYLQGCFDDGSLVYVLKTHGLALGVIFQDWMSPAMLCADLAFFLLPECRGRLGLADDLYQEFEDRARSAGVAQIIMTNQHPDFEIAADRFYRSRGLHAVGRTYQKEL
ncbi:MAG: GNAT family N-acetyltransferase [Geminicoccaceae bacterium]